MNPTDKITCKLDPFLKTSGTVIDVRSPKEFLAGKIPGAINLPLFSDQERHEVGICYKQEGQKQAIALGLEFVAQKIEGFIDQVLNLKTPLKVYCWRGGMRSRSMGQLFQTVGIITYVLQGGYRSWRQEALRLFSTSWDIRRVSGLTGTGKTEFLHTLKLQGEQILDLEGLANHRGSVFGNRGAQPTTEQFHNLIAEELAGMNPKHPLWVEDESQAIGACHIPTGFFVQIRKAKRHWIEKPIDERLETICSTYSLLPKSQLIESIRKLQNKLGGERTKQAIQSVEQENFKEAAMIILAYYDKAYRI